MAVFSRRENRVLAAVGLGILVAVIVASFTPNPRDSAIVRGDFPAFYTMAVVAKEGLGERLYDLSLQQEIQARYWDSLSTSVLPVAYPPYLAALLLPLAYLKPSVARGAWIICNTLATLWAVVIMSQSLPALRAYRWQMGVLALSFFPLLAGVIGGQSVGLSLILLAAIIALSKSPLKARHTELGILAGLWMFKPHYALAVVWVFLLQRRTAALVSWTLTCLVLWLLGVSVSGINWLQHWLAFAQRFSHIDILTNADQMTGIVPFVYSVARRSGLRDLLEPDILLQISSAVAIVTPFGLFLINRLVSRSTPQNNSLPYLMIAPLLLISAPAANFYDLSLLLIPLSAALSPSHRQDRLILATTIILSGYVVLARECGIYGCSFCFAAALGAFVSMRLLRAPRSM